MKLFPSTSICYLLLVLIIGFSDGERFSGVPDSSRGIPRYSEGSQQPKKRTILNRRRTWGNTDSLLCCAYGLFVAYNRLDTHGLAAFKNNPLGNLYRGGEISDAFRERYKSNDRYKSNNNNNNIKYDNKSIKNGGGGSSAMNSQRARPDRGVALDETTARLKREARDRAERELRELEREARRMGEEFQRAARIKAVELEKVARSKASEYALVAQAKAAQYETSAKRAALEVASQWEATARKKASDYEALFRKRASEFENESRRRVNQLEMGYSRRAGVAMGYRSNLLSNNQEQSLLTLLVTFTIIVSVTNLAGWDVAHVDNWAIFDFPFDFLNANEKRFFAGTLEFASACLMLNGRKTRRYGTGLMGCMLLWASWASYFNTQLDTWKVIVTNVAAIIACVLFANDGMR